MIDQIAQDLYSGKLKPADLNQQIISKTYEQLEKAAAKGYGKDWIQFPADGKGATPMYLKKNLYAFSGAKGYTQLEAINQLLYDADGKLRPFNEFAVYAKKINRQYNMNYLQAEYQTARTAAQMVEKWERLQKTKDLFPNLKYRTVGDDRVRQDHQQLDGIIKSIDDPFWNKYYPPLDWRCRCDVVATAEDETNDDNIGDLPPVQFIGNVGKDKEIFTPKGTYFRLAATNTDATRTIELSKLNAPYERAFKANNGKELKINITADPVDLENNIKIGKVIVNHMNENVFVRPHIDSWIVKGHKNPEYLINGKLADRKTPVSTNYSNILSKANKQGCEIVVIDLSKNKDTLENALIKIDNILKLNVHTTIREVYIVSADKKEVKLYERKKRS